jgi:hypothetical protein
MFTLNPLQLRGRIICSEEQYNASLIDRENHPITQTGRQVGE